MKTSTLFAAALLAAPLSAGAADGAASAYLWKGGEDTQGLGLKGWVGLGQSSLFLNGRLQSGSIGGGFGGDLDYSEARLGAGVGVDLGKGAAVFFGAQAVGIDVEDESENGVALGAGFEITPADRLSVDVGFGLVEAGDVEGSELDIGMGYAIDPRFALSISRSEQVVTGATTHVGIRFAF